MAEALAEAGASIAVLDLHEARCHEVAEGLHNTYGVRVLALPLDLSDNDVVRRAPGTVLNEFGRLDVIIHSAALVSAIDMPGWAVPFEEQDVSLWPKALQINTTSAFQLVQAATPALRSSGHGSVINVISHYGLVGPDWSLYQGTSMANVAAYAASKGGLLQLTRWLATTLAPEVRVNAITPGGVLRNHIDPFLSRYIAHTPLHRMGREEDLKGAALYLASDLSSYVTGHNLVVDGGITIW
jgi:NAD(P)-dependent dehydrogenase (short-subunit alcohol dehydrogenase family)